MYSSNYITLSLSQPQLELSACKSYARKPSRHVYNRHGEHLTPVIEEQVVAESVTSTCRFHRVLVRGRG